MAKKTEDFENRLENAKKILERLMSPEITLENSVKAYQDGMKELAEAQKILEDATIKIQEIKAS